LQQNFFLDIRHFVCCDFLASTTDVRVILKLPLSEMYATVGSAIACDRLRLYGNNSLYDRLRLSAIIWKPAFSIDLSLSQQTSKREPAEKRKRISTGALSEFTVHFQNFELFPN